MRFAFAGDRDIAVSVLDFILSTGEKPLALLVSGKKKATHADILRNQCSFLSDDYIFEGIDFKNEESIRMLESLKLDFVIGVHFPYIISKEFLDLPKVGFINLHPAYLPYNKGWHTPSWAILDGTPIGGTLHFMDEGIDSGDIILQKIVEVRPNYTADSLYRSIKECEISVFKEAWPKLLDGTYQRVKQVSSEGTFHAKKDLFCKEVQYIDLEKEYPANELINKLKALTTSSLDEAAYFEVQGKKYKIQVQIYETE